MTAPLEALVFDAYGTLFDVHSVAAECERLFPGQGEAFSRLWRAKQLEYSWLLALMGRYEDFREVTERALKFACRTLNTACDPEIRHRLMTGYLRLATFPEVPETLGRLSGLPLAILSNGSPGMLGPVVANAGLAGRFAHVISVDEAKTYKPSPVVYELATRRLGLAREKIGFVSSNSWDAGGAASFGFRVFWINRSGAVPDDLGFAPAAVIGSLAELPPLAGL